MVFKLDQVLGGKMESEFGADCIKTRELIDRLTHAETVSDDETTRIILHTQRCEGCKIYLANALRMNNPVSCQE